MSGVAGAFERAASAGTTAPSMMASRRPIYDRLLLLPMALLVWALIVLMIVPEGFDYRMLVDDYAPMAGSRLSRMLWLSLLGSGVVIVAWRVRLAWVLTLSTLNLFLLLFAALAVASIVWSIDPGVTTRRGIRIVTIISVALAFVLVGWHVRRFQNVVRPILTLMLGGSLIFGVMSPELAIHHETEGMLAGAWKGLANHKNALGNLACISLIFWFHAGLAKQVRLRVAIAGAGVAIVCLVLSESTTSLLTALFAIAFLTLLMRAPAPTRGYLPWVVVLFVITSTVYSLALLQIIPGLSKLMGPVSLLTGKDMSFTGRTDIWYYLSEHIKLNPLLGSGYGAYWVGVVPGTPSFVFVEQLHFYPASAHNGYLDIANDLGAAGLAVLIGYLLVFVRQTLKLLPIDRSQAALYLALFLQQVITNLSESRWLSVQSVDFVIMTLATFALGRSLLDIRLRKSFHARRAMMSRPGPEGGPHANETLAIKRADDVRPH